MQEQQLIQARWIVTMEDEQPVLENHGILIENNLIKAILNPVELSKQNIPILKLDNHILLPGLINLHGHSAMNLFRGYADDLALMDWLNNHIWPLEKRFVNEEFVYDGSLLAMAEMILSGTTTINDMYFYHSSMAKAGLKAGLRTFVGCSILEFPTNYGENANDYIDKALAEKAQFSGEELITFTLAPHAPYTVADETFKRIVSIAEKENMLIHCHIHETEDEINESLKQYQQRPFQRLKELGVLQQRLIAAHMVHLNEDEITESRALGLSIAHNPSSNMKLASGFAPIQQLLEAGVNVGLGTDGAASNNSLNMLGEMHLAALIAKGITQNPVALKAYEVLKMATINGAKALHLEDKIGSIKVGKSADIIAVEVDSIENQPIYDPISHLVYSLDRENISDVWVNGRQLLKNHLFTRLPIQEIKEKALYWTSKISQQNRS